MDDIVSEPVDLEVSDVPDAETPPEPETKRRAHQATSKAAPKARVRAPVVEVPDVAEVVEPPVEPNTPAPKARARPAVRASAPALAPSPAPGISDVLNMLANALLDQRQARASQRQAMYSRFLD